MIKQFSCLLTDVIRLTMASCDYRECTQTCIDYLLQIGTYCPHVFNNERYSELWNTLFNLCDETVVQNSPFFLEA
jgi:hypothetical protein